MNGNRSVTVLPTTAVSAALFECVNRIASRMIQRAAGWAPATISERLDEEWQAHLSELGGSLLRLRFAVGCYWAATMIGRDPSTAKAPATSASTVPTTLTAYSRHGSSFFSRRGAASAAARDAVMCEINTTPLIDVMLVLLVTLIVSLPMMTHAVKLDMPQTHPPVNTPPPDVVDLDIDFDGTVVWNGTPIANLQQLDTYFKSEAARDSQPEIHLRPDRRAKYDVVARVLASAQRNGMAKIGMVNTAEFQD